MTVNKIENLIRFILNLHIVYLYAEEVSVLIGVVVVVCKITLSLVVSLVVVAEVLECPYLCFLNGLIVGEKRFEYLEGFLLGCAEYFLRVEVLTVVVEGVVVVIIVVEVRESLY